MAWPWSLVEASASITIESPIRTSACPIFPSGVGMLSISSASNAFFTKSRSALASSTARYGVTLRYPSGIGLTAIAPPSSRGAASYRWVLAGRAVLEDDHPAPPGLALGLPRDGGGQQLEAVGPP